jgi:hypothetical protein
MAGAEEEEEEEEEAEGATMTNSHRHGRACPGHPRFRCRRALKTWMPGIKPGMTDERPCVYVITPARYNAMDRVT